MCEILEKTPSPGDIIYTRRGLYKHYGVYVGSGQVIHFAGSRGHEINASMSNIVKTSIPEFLKGGKLFIQPDRTINPLPAKEVVRRAESVIGNCKEGYSFVIGNCKHFANWCRYGKLVLTPLDKALTAVSTTGTLLLLLLVHRFRTRKDNSSNQI